VYGVYSGYIVTSARDHGCLSLPLVRAYTEMPLSVDDSMNRNSLLRVLQRRISVVSPG